MSMFSKQASAHLLWIVSFVALSAASCATDTDVAPAEERESPRAVRVSDVQVRTLRESVAYVGTVRSSREVDIVARVAGTVIALPVREGESVAADEVVVELDDAEFRSRRAQVRSELQRARTQREHVCANAETDRQLSERGVVTVAQADASRAACQSAAATVDLVEARLDEVESLLDRTEEEAPFTGIVLRRHVEVGENAVPGRPLVTLGDGSLEVVTRVTEGDLRRGVAVGAPASLVADAGVEVLSTVSDVSPLLNAVGRTAEVAVPLPNGAVPGLMHGASVSVTFTLRVVEDASTVPAIAITTRSGVPGVFVIDADDRAHWHPVAERIRASNRVAVEPPLPEGARVAVSNLDVLGDNDPVYAVASEP
jgi:RND family efflux transporter MFP subunit